MAHTGNLLLRININFLQILDADHGCRLESSTGRVATRDIVQFVPMREVHSKYKWDLALQIIVNEFKDVQ